MLDHTNCQQCGRKLQNVIYCSVCRRGVCSICCYDAHFVQHGPPVTASKPVAELAQKEQS